MPTTEQLLSQILGELKGIRVELAKGGGKAEARSSGKASDGDAASDRELDGDHGDMPVRKNPPRWNVDVNGSYVGCNLSECPVDFLETLAGFFDWQASKDEEAGKMHNGKPTAPWRRKDARLCRGWARRKRDGWTPPAAPQGGASGPDDSGGDVLDEIPF